MYVPATLTITAFSEIIELNARWQNIMRAYNTQLQPIPGLAYTRRVFAWPL